MFLIILQGALIVLRIFLSINVAALNVGRSLAKKASGTTDEVAENLDEKDSAASTVGSVAAKGSSATLKVVDATATGARTVLKIIIGLLDVVIAVSLLATILVIIIAALGIVLLAFVSSFVSMNFYESCETPSNDDKASSEVASDSDEKDKKEEKKKQKECTPIGSSSSKKDAEKGKEEKTTGDASNSDEVNKMIAYFKSAQGNVSQDCTDAVQNALDAAGLFTSRQKGGYDMGPQHSDWADRVESYKSMGALPQDQWQAGDIISVPGHVYMYLGNGEYGHGGWSGLQTVVNDYVDPRQPSEVARFQGK